MSPTQWECRILDSVSDLEKFVDLEIAVWGLDPRDAVPTSLLHAMAFNGGLVVGVYDRDEMIGMAFAFPAIQNAKRILWSHMTGVRPDYQGKGVGFALKQFQRTWALEQGYTKMGWTFDPLQRGNANFNLHGLGVTAQTYHINLYGEMTDGINAGLPSDRLEVIWDLRQKRVQKLAKGVPDSPSVDIIMESPYLLRAVNDKALECPLPPRRPNICRIEIPNDIANLKRNSPQTALTWRLAVRSAFQLGFANNFRATDFLTLDGHSFYVLTVPEVWYLYLLRCSDDTFYTGVTPDLRRRVNLHNSGRGAAYTAQRVPVKLVGAWQFANRSDALKAEIAFKKQPRHRKLDLANQRAPYQNAPFIEVEVE
jgi:predicted GNAT superfamily acetyltransferase/predicted GIY-YIG superfamily endonuclease